MPPTTAAPTAADVPAPPAGEVDRHRLGARATPTGDSTEVTDQSTRADLQRARSATALDREVLRRLRRPAAPSRPTPAEPLVPAELPELDNGPHFFYGLQWWFFGVLAVFGFFYLVYDECASGRGPAAPPSARRAAQRAASSGVDGTSEGAQHAAVDRAASRP